MKDYWNEYGYVIVLIGVFLFFICLACMISCSGKFTTKKYRGRGTYTVLRIDRENDKVVTQAKYEKPGWSYMCGEGWENIKEGDRITVDLSWNSGAAYMLLVQSPPEVVFSGDGTIIVPDSIKKVIRTSSNKEEVNFE